MERSAVRSSVGVLDARADAEGRRVRSWYRPRDDAVAIARGHDRAGRVPVVAFGRGRSRAVALHGRALAPVLAVAALVELGEPRRAVRVGRALTPPAAVTSCNPAEPCTTVAQTCTTSPPYCCTQSLDWVEGRCVLVAA